VARLLPAVLQRAPQGAREQVDVRACDAQRRLELEHVHPRPGRLDDDAELEQALA
jgi:hypothetical protein